MPLMEEISFFKNLEAFYEEEPRRRWSREMDFGVHWHQPPWPHPWRVSYLRETGEVYAVHQDDLLGPVLVLGVVPPDNDALFYRTLEKALDGWTVVAHLGARLRWIRNRLVRASGRASA